MLFKSAASAIGIALICISVLDSDTKTLDMFLSLFGGCLYLYSVMDDDSPYKMSAVRMLAIPLATMFALSMYTSSLSKDILNSHLRSKHRYIKEAYIGDSIRSSGYDFRMYDFKATLKNGRKMQIIASTRLYRRNLLQITGYAKDSICDKEEFEDFKR